MDTKKSPQIDVDWKKKLTPEQYRILRQKGTEAPFTGEYTDTITPGVYYCVACGLKLFKSAQKYPSSCGWASFWDMADEGAIKFVPDDSFGMNRTEVQCYRCGGHLGHIFDDPASLAEIKNAGGPKTGKRYCINSGALEFKSK